MRSLGLIFAVVVVAVKALPAVVDGAEASSSSRPPLTTVSIRRHHEAPRRMISSHISTTKKGVLPNYLDSSTTAFVVPRGGDQPVAAKKKRRRSSSSKASTGDEQPPKKRRKTKITEQEEEEEEEDEEDGSEEEGTEKIKEAMRRNKDTAAALGDAIRDRADVLRSDDLASTSSPLHGVDASIASLGLALGTSDPARSRAREAAAAAAGASDDNSIRDENDGGGVQASSSAVLANYFLQSHGGAHGVQSLLSLLSVLAGLGALFLPPPTVSVVDGTVPTGTKGWIKLILLRRCLLCALAKHAAGLVAVTTLSASRIPAVGLRQTRKRIEALALDPVAQYLFYCALLLVWAPSLSASTGAIGKKAAAKAAEAAATAGAAATASAIVVPKIPWWFDDKTTSFYSTMCLLGPIMLREVVSTAWVISDVFVILASSGGSEGGEPFLLTAARGSVDAFLSLLFTPSKWRGADSATRQKMLAKLVAKTSLALEILTGLIILYDAVRAFSDYTLSPVGARPTLLSVAKRVTCARLYINFMLVRRKKISSLVTVIRGGAYQVPGRILDVLLEPKKAMGLDDEEDDDVDELEEQDASSTKCRARGWLDYASMALDV